jgi:hypothetical protein
MIYNNQRIDINGLGDKNIIKESLITVNEHAKDFYAY